MINKIKNYITENREYIDRDMILSEYILVNAKNADDGFEFWLGDDYSDEAYNNFVSLINYNLDITIWEIYSRLYEDNKQYILDCIIDKICSGDFKICSGDFSSPWLTDFIYKETLRISESWGSVDNTLYDGYHDYIEECVDNELYNGVDKFETVKFLVDETGCFDIDCINYIY